MDIDTGALIFSTAMMESLYSLVETEEDYAASLPANSRSPASIKGQSSQKTSGCRECGLKKQQGMYPENHVKTSHS